MRWLPALALLALLLAGCGHPSGAGQVRLGDGRRLSLDLPSDQAPSSDDIRGAVSGVVVDQAIFPLANATVSIRDRHESATTDAEGRFSFLAQSPGLYTLDVRRDGYSDGVGTINVHSGQVTKSILQVTRLPEVTPYHTTWQFNKVRSSTDFLVYDVPADLVAYDTRPASVIVESVWDFQDPTSGAAGGSALSYNVSSQPDAKRSVAGDGANPLRLELPKELMAAKDYAIRVHVAPAGLVSFPPDAGGRTFVTVFYGAPAPEGWSLVAGDT